MEESGSQQDDLLVLRISRRMAWKLALVPVVLVGLYGLYYSLSLSRVWLVRTYADQTFKEETVEAERRLLVRFYRPVTPPFAARWDSCLVLEEPAEVTFKLGSDDGMRLYVDGTMVINVWRAHAFEFREVKRKLTKGTHHLRIDYLQKGGEGALQLKFALGDGPLEDMSPSYLRFPGWDFSPEDPCGEIGS